MNELEIKKVLKMSSVDGNQLDARAALEEELATRSTAEIIIEVISVIVIGLIGFCKEESWILWI